MSESPTEGCSTTLDMDQLDHVVDMYQLFMVAYFRKHFKYPSSHLCKYTPPSTHSQLAHCAVIYTVVSKI